MSLLAEKHASGLGLSIADLFSYQFVLSPDPTDSVPGFISRPFGDRRLLHCPKLEVAVLFDNQGMSIGFCLGVAVDHAGERVAVSRSLDFSVDSPDFWVGIERFAAGLAGRWLLLMTDGNEQRVFGDAGGMYNCVYDPKSGGVGSTLLMSLLREIEETDELDFTLTLSHGMRLPFGRTRDRHAKRLSVNHYLRLDDWSETRFWPGADEFDEVEAGGEMDVVAEISERLGSIMKGIVTTLPTAIGVSGGNDSRNLVAAGKPVLGHVNRYFSHTHSYNARTDYRSAVLMMKAFGHRVERHPLAKEPFTDTEIAERNRRYQISTGFCVGLQQMSNVKLQRELPPGEVALTGNVMEALRAAHWKSPKTQRRNALVFGLKRCLFAGSVPFDDTFIQKWLPEYKIWLLALPKKLQARYIDLLFVEHNIPNLGASYFAMQENFYMCPFNDRRIIALCARLPVSYRFSNQSNRDFLRITAPELLEVPFAEDLRRKPKSAA